MLATSKNCVDMHSYNRPMKNILLLTKYCKSPILHLKKECTIIPMLQMKEQGQREQVTCCDMIMLCNRKYVTLYDKGTLQL